MAKTTNYQWDLPSPYGIQITEIAKIAAAFGGVDAALKALSDAFQNHETAFSDLVNRPDTLEGFGITDGMTAAEISAAIQAAIASLVDDAGPALDTLRELAAALGNDPNFATTTSTTLGNRVRADAAQSFTLAQKAQARANIDALGTVDKGQTNGVASLDSTGKVPSTQLPALTTTATVGAAVAGANSKQTPDDGDFFTGVLAGGSTMFKTTWANIKAALSSVFLPLTGGTLTGAVEVSVAALTYAFHVRSPSNSNLGGLYVSATGGELYARGNDGTTTVIKGAGESGIAGSLTVGGSVIVGTFIKGTTAVYAGAAYMATDGNVTGSKWGGGWLYDWIEARSYNRTKDYLLGENTPIDSTILGIPQDNVAFWGTLDGSRINWANLSGTDLNNSVGAIGYGTWMVMGIKNASNGSHACTCKRIG